MTLVRTINAAWMLSCQGALRAFHRASDDVAAAQRRLLCHILRRNADSEFGRRYRFNGIHDTAEFQRRVPPCDYDDLAAAIDRIAAGAPNVLTAERVLLLQPTSGSTSDRKLIPYTATLRTQYQRCVSAWVGDLFRRRPNVRRGRAYWSISPALDGPRATAGGVPIGFDDDAAYLGTWRQRIVRRLLVVPADAAGLRDVDAFRRATLSALLAADDLSLVSVWSPTFLLALIDALPQHAERLADELGDALSARRAGIVRRIARDGVAAPDDIAALWPQLALVSCWTGAASASHARRLHERLPHVEMQPKGLMATEACISFPLVGAEGCPLALCSTFLEFQPFDASGGPGGAGPCLLAHQLDPGGRYAVVLTTGGGLYRYRLGDIVEVVGRLRQCPLVQFVGRTGCASDLVGEKLTDPFVQRVVGAALSRQGVRPRFVLLVPADETRRGYRLFLQLDPGAAVDQRQLARDVEDGLRDNPHYEYAVRLGQLAPVRVAVLDACGESAFRAVERRAVAAGQKLGDIKPAWLASGDDWAATFAQLIEREVAAT